MFVYLLRRMGIAALKRVTLIAATALSSAACSAPVRETPLPVQPKARAATLPAERSPTPDSEAESTPPTPSPAPLSLDSLAGERDLTLWKSSVSPGGAHPITSEVLNNPATYGAFIDALLVELDRAAQRVQALRDLGTPVVVEVRWNGVSSYTENTEVDVFLRDAGQPEQILWIEKNPAEFASVAVGTLSSVTADFPGEFPAVWQDPGRLVFADDPEDSFARGLQVLDSDGHPVALWDEDVEAFRPWRRDEPYRAKLANGFDITFLGFSDAELDLIWEAFLWIDLGVDRAGEFLDKVVTIRRGDLPLWVAGVGGRGDIRIAPQSLTAFRDAGYARMVDAIWAAQLVVHEAAHVNQVGECTPAYAASRGMTLREYGLFLETGPGQAYEQEARFLERLLGLRDESGNLRLADVEVRSILTDQLSYLFDTLGQEAFPDGTPVPTCADGG